MSTSLLYHGFGIRGYAYVKTEYEGGRVKFTICQKVENAPMPYHGIEIPDQIIADFCQRHHVRQLCLFGSILRDDFRPE